MEKKTGVKTSLLWLITVVVFALTVWVYFKK